MYRVGIAIGVVLAALVTAPQLSAADDDNGGGNGTTLQFFEVIDKTHLVDNTPTGSGTGDVFLFDSKLLASRGGSQLGRIVGQCRQLFVEARCEATMLLARGTIEVAGGVDLTQPSVTAAVLGGTGRYHAVSGQVTFVLGSDGNQVTVRLSDD